MLMSKTKDLIDETLEKREKIRDELIDKGVKDLDEKLKSDKYTVESLISDSSIGEVYHDLIDSKDQINSEHQKLFNKKYHEIDVELYKMNKKIDRKARMIEYEMNNKKNNVYQKIREDLD